jgi:predicted TIM-barrel fold metal-dependent hydrolase
MRSYELISADSHVNPLPTFWRDYLPAKYRDRAPRLESTDEGDFVVFEGQRRIFATLGGIGGKDTRQYKHVGKVSDTRVGGWDPKARLADLDLDGVDAEVLFGGGPLRTSDPELYEASFDAYNRWLADFCGHAPERFLGVAYIPVLDPQRAAQTVRDAAQRRFRGVLIPSFPPKAGEYTDGMMGGDHSRHYGGAEWKPFWDAVTDTGLVLHMHLGARPVSGIPELFLTDMLMSKISMAEPLSLLIFTGVFERYPQVRLVSVESNIGWFPFAKEYMDKTFEKHRYWTRTELKRLPSEYWNEHIYATFLHDKAGIELRHSVGVDNIMWSSDYPHSETTFPESRKDVAEHFAGLPAEETRKMTCGNAMRLYRLG